MHILDRHEELKYWRTQHRDISFVPTMGSLHAGHMALVEAAHSSAFPVLVSIFLNPTQFNNTEDFQKYPVQIEEDLRMLKEAGVEAVFLPSKDEIYSDNYEMRINDFGENSQVLCAATRPGHFEGVLTVVMKLVQMTKANVLYLGEKDFQQLTLIQKMLQSFFLETKIVAVPTVRDEAGLALSSRNQRLTPESLALARTFAGALAKSAANAGSVKALREELQSQGIKIDYIDDRWGRRFAAVIIDGVRLIDNVQMDREISYDTHA